MNDNDTFDEKMPFLGHLEEIYMRIRISLLAFLIALIPSILMLDFFMAKLVKSADTYGVLLKTESPVEFISVGFVCLLLSSVALAFPFWLWQIWSFVSPALFNNEKKICYLFFLFIITLPGSGIYIALTYSIPATLNIISDMGRNIAEQSCNLNSYFWFVLRVILVNVFICEIPVIVFVFGKKGIIAALSGCLLSAFLFSELVLSVIQVVLLFLIFLIFAISAFIALNSFSDIKEYFKSLVQFINKYRDSKDEIEDEVEFSLYESDEYEDRG